MCCHRITTELWGQKSLGFRIDPAPKQPESRFLWVSKEGAAASTAAVWALGWPSFLLWKTGPVVGH